MNKKKNPILFFIPGVMLTITAIIYAFILRFFGILLLLLGTAFNVIAIVRIYKNVKRKEEIQNFFFEHFDGKLDRYIEGKKSWNYGAIGIDIKDGTIIANKNVVRMSDVTNVELIRKYTHEGGVTTFNNGNGNLGFGAYGGTSSEEASGIRIYINSIKKPIIIVDGDTDFSYESYSTILVALNSAKSKQ